MTSQQQRERLKHLLRRAGMLPALAWLRYLVRLFLSPVALKQEWGLWKQYLEVKRGHGRALRYRPNGPPQKRALVAAMGMLSFINVELALFKALQLAGYRLVVMLGWRHPLLDRYYRLAGVEEILHLDEIISPIEPCAAEAVVAGIKSTDQLLDFEYQDTRVGRFAAAGSLRRLRTGDLDFESDEVRRHVTHYLSAAMRSAAAARVLIRRVEPQLAMFVDRGYTPQGELFDQCLVAGIDVVTYNSAHRNNRLIFKRYRSDTRDVHPVSLSHETWDRLQRIEWTESHRRRLRDEICSSYTKGEWYGEVGTQFQKRIVSRSELARRLGLDPGKKTAAIFSHIFWDATFFWGTDLFANYEEWFVETLQAACANPSVNWIVKVHPANVTKNRRDGVSGEPSEILAIRQWIGELPSHVVVIPADSDINTYSLFDLMDYCLTVRGTIGIEAASFGITVLTAGTGRYDHLRFTLDSETREAYLANLARITDLPPLSPVQREMAERFAHGVFLLRPLPLQSVTLEYQQDATATIRSQFRIQTSEAWADAPDLRALATWINSGCDDFLLPDGPGSLSGD